jgi:hypothetical protein
MDAKRKERFKNSKFKNKIKRLRGDTDTRLHQVIREKGFYNMTLKERE